MDTKLVSQWKLAPQLAERHGISSNVEETIENIREQAVEQFLQQSQTTNPITQLLTQCYQQLAPILAAERWVCLENNIYLDKRAGGFWLMKSFGKYASGKNIDDIETAINQVIGDPINDWVIPDEETARCLCSLKDAPFSTVDCQRYSNGYKYEYTGIKLLGDFQYVLCDYNSQTRGAHLDARLSDKYYDEGIALPFTYFNTEDLSPRALFIEILESGFTLFELESDDIYHTLLKLFHDMPNLFVDSKQDADSLISQFYGEILLNIDTQRADLQPYHNKILDDTALGHWSLWQDELNTQDYLTIDLPQKMVARDPKSSVHDGVVAIDFGTKSTVVVYQKDNVNIHPMRIGTGDLSKEIAAHHYENPTIMEFIHLAPFIQAYQAQPYRPDTRWQDLTISHTAYNSMHGSESSKFNTFLDALKQWAGDKNRKLKVVGQHGKVIDLPPFLELADDDFNPIEIYAYYLGLYINNLNNGIFLDYIMSFPVTYEVAVRNKLIASFKKGLTKSLPAELGEDTIKQLSVSQGASEPAAYALTALQEYGLEPQGSERIFYSVFDFGGGTTDFDFGIYREPSDARDQRRFDYVIEHFGAGGDQFLGGENLLELLAFEVFKANKSRLLEHGIQFEKHPEKDAFAGSEQLISSSQEARTNTKQLCIALRPFWEEHADFSFDASGEISVTLTDKSGLQHSAFALDIDAQQLEQILSDRIERGVINFFEALRLAFSNSQQMLSDIDSVKIFLAGNASQSRFVKQLFDKHIELQHQAMGLNEEQSRFELFAPLGADKSNVEKPTGKTGVAFGLITSREGGRIKVVDHNLGEKDIRFKFYLGEARKGQFKPLIDREVTFNQWVEFTYADYQKFEIYYTDHPSCTTGQMAINDASIKKKTVKLDFTDQHASVYLRVISPTEIEYVIALPEQVTSNNYLGSIQSIQL
ncbi:molecular chaperone DnaK [Vibrio metschnikovii]|uniref:Molecular chaperone DnaK n=1 Tax=Vibrio metschnikovii TaxID=28172 RepID=A0A9X0R7E9_VIBME|nr:molecular chaperone DnaK [Vibrio metschnikovii]MBC5850186.1 molecular chaperone DnaK [Vibrio metschnikovii]MDA3138882.1 molecular chaperone DnaK [Vibrio metschnikovii]